VRVPFYESLHFDPETGKTVFNMVEGIICPGKKPFPLKRADGSYDTAICSRYDTLMGRIQEIAKEVQVLFIFFLMYYLLFFEY
jgi:hypothetical protein